MQETEWILRKQKIINQVSSLLSERIERIKNCVLSHTKIAYPEILSSLPKVSKGENYQSLPYVILDYPSVFSKKDVFALRTMFWWGHFFSVTLQISGLYLDKWGSCLCQNLKHSGSAYFICVNENAWHHHFEKENYRPVSQISEQDLDIIFNKPFIKIAQKFPLNKWNEMPHLLDEAYLQILKLLED